MKESCTLLACIDATRSTAAGRLGINKRTLLDRLRKYGVSPYQQIEPTPMLYEQASEVIDSLDDMLFHAVVQQA